MTKKRALATKGEDLLIGEFLPKVQMSFHPSKHVPAK
jgi:hypothetical protein